MSRRLLFAYGTLLTGARDPAVARALRRACRSLGPATVAGRLFDQGGYPGLVSAPRGGGTVHGELLRLAAGDALLALLDRYEDFDPRRPAAGEYRRVLVAVEHDGRHLPAWTYLLNTRRVRPGRPLPAGRWRRTHARRPGPAR